MSKADPNEGVDISKPHLMTSTYTEALYYPAHPPRKESGIYKETHHTLVYTKDMPCWICGVRQSDFDNDGRGVVSPHNPFGAKQNETHHKIIEWAAAEGIDWDKVLKDYPDLPSLQHVARAWDLQFGRGHQLPRLEEPRDARGDKIRHPAFKNVHYTEIDTTEFLDGVEQMLVLCDVHHRAPYYGVHHTTGPIFPLQRYQRKNFAFIPQHMDEKIQHERNKNKE